MDGSRLPPSTPPSSPTPESKGWFDKVKAKATEALFGGSSRSVKKANVSPQLKRRADTQVTPEKRTLSEYEIEAGKQEVILNEHNDELIEDKDGDKELLKRLQELRLKVFRVVKPYREQLKWLEEKSGFDKAELTQLRQTFKDGPERSANALQKAETQLQNKIKRQQAVDLPVVESSAKQVVAEFKLSLEKFKNGYFSKTLKGIPEKKTVESRPVESKVVSSSKKSAEVKTSAEFKNKLLRYKEAVGILAEGLAKSGNSEHLLTELIRVSEKVQVEAAGLLNSYTTLTDSDAKFFTQTLGFIADYGEQLKGLKSQQNEKGQKLDVSAIADFIKPSASELQKTIGALLEWKPGKKMAAPLAVTPMGVLKSAAKPVAVPTQAANSFLKLSSLKSPELRHHLENYQKAATKKDKTIAREKLAQYVVEQKQLYSRLQPLLSAAASKSSVMSSEPLLSVGFCQNWLSKLDSDASLIGSQEESKEFLGAIVRADEAITELERFDQSISSDLSQLLTRSLPDPATEFDHLQNLLVRSILHESSGKLTDKNLQKLEQLHAFHGQFIEQRVTGGNVAATFKAYLDVVADVFATTESVKALAQQARTLEELRALGTAIQDWQSEGVNELQWACEHLKVISKDLSLPAVFTGLENIGEIKSHFAGVVNENGKVQAEERLAVFNQRLEEGVKRYATNRIKNQSLSEMFKSHKKFAESLQAELNRELGGVAEIEIESTESGVKIIVHSNLKTSEDAVSRAGQLVNRADALAEALIKEIQSEPPQDLLKLDEGSAQYSWSPHPEDMLKEGAAHFVNRYESFQKGLSEVKQNSPHIRRTRFARGRVDQAAVGLKNEVESYTPSRKRPYTLPDGLSDIGQLPLNKITGHVKETGKSMTVSLMAGDLSVSQAEKLLPALLVVGEHASGRMLESEKVLKSEKKLTVSGPAADELNKFRKKLRPKWVFKLFRSKRLKALEATDRLLSVCVRCEKSPGMTSALLYDISFDMQTKWQSYPELRGALSMYCDQFDNSFVSKPIELPSEFVPQPARLPSTRASRG